MARTQHINERFRNNPRNRELFLQLFREPNGLTRCLRRMNLYGVLGRYLPNFGHIVGQMQHDLFHVYTVDEHILMVVRNLRRFASSAFTHEYPLMSRLINDFERPETLYLAGLFHDIAKGRGGDHSTLGMADAADFCRQHGLPAEDGELVVWLVGQHLTMSSVAQKQDIYDPETVRRFAELAGTPRRLTALYLLTVADIRGTSPKVWNAWKAKLLEDLYHAAMRQLVRGGQLDVASELEERKHQAQALLRLHAVPSGVEAALWQELDTVYFLRHEAKEIAWHARLLNRFVHADGPLVRARLSDDHEGIQVLIYTRDRPELFARACAFFGRTHYSIADAKVLHHPPRLRAGHFPRLRARAS
ncbi:HD domain-containing protein [Chromobacterium haemolyticum]|nr:HD domain-containing protein [Chromobacterium haemolyticum]